MLDYVDYATLLLIAFVCAIASTLFYGTYYFDSLVDEHRHEAYGFFASGLPLTVLGFHMVLTWPLKASHPFTGNANIVLGWPALFFGLLFLMAGLVIRFEHGKGTVAFKPLTRIARIGAVMQLALAIAILKTGTGVPPSSEAGFIRILFGPVTWASVYLASAIAAFCSGWALDIRKRLIRRIVFCLLCFCACLFLLAGFGTIISHVQLFSAFPH